MRKALVSSARQAQHANLKCPSPDLWEAALKVATSLYRFGRSTTTDLIEAEGEQLVPKQQATSCDARCY
jgi:hypothetical protein